MERQLRSAKASRSRPAQQQPQRPRRRGAGAGLTRIIAAGAGGVGQAAQNFGFRNATRVANAVESSAAQQTRNASSSRLGKERRRSRETLPPSQRPATGNGAAVGGLGAATLGLGLGAVGGAYEGARYTLGGNADDGSSSDQAPDIRTLNNMQQGARSNRSA